MKCKRAKQEMALSAGRDLDPAAERELQQHLTNCPSCHNHWNRISATTSILHQAGLEEAEVPTPRLWSNLSRSIQAAPRRQTARPKFLTPSNVLVSMVAVASLLLAVLSIKHSLDNPPPSQSHLISGGFRPSEGTAVGARILPPRRMIPPESPLKRQMEEEESLRTPPDSEEYLDVLPNGRYRLEK